MNELEKTCNKHYMDFGSTASAEMARHHDYARTTSIETYQAEQIAEIQAEQTAEIQAEQIANHAENTAEIHRLT